MCSRTCVFTITWYCQLSLLSINTIIITTVFFNLRSPISLYIFTNVSYLFWGNEASLSVSTLSSSSLLVMVFCCCLLYCSSLWILCSVYSCSILFSFSPCHTHTHINLHIHFYHTYGYSISILINYKSVFLFLCV